jgi:SAM-dependent methyltransferase
MPRIDNEKFYISAIEKHGTTARGVNWASKANQTLRFKTLLELLPQDLSPCSLVDAGCGFGDFYLYLEKKKKLPKKYIGIDSLSEMYSIASNNTAQEILIADITSAPLPVEDYYVCSGALNTLTKYESIAFIQNCYNSSKIGFIFNALHGNKESQTYNYLSKDEIQTIANTLGVHKITYKEGYLEDDITVGFFR